MIGDHDGDDLAQMDMYLGPYEYWNFGPGREYALPAIRHRFDYITALAEFVHPTELADAVTAGEGDGERPKAWRTTLWGEGKLKFLPFVVTNPFDRSIDPTRLGNLLRDGLSEIGWPTAAIGEPRFRVAFPVSPAAMNEGLPGGPGAPAWQADDTLRDRLCPGSTITVMAVIDDGIPFAHRNFRGKDGKGTRIEFCWLQSASRDSGAKGGSVLFGREHTRQTIDDLIATHGGDEDILYREAGATSDVDELGPVLNRHATHGAHVMDLATGYRREMGEVPNEAIRIISVQLPNTIAWDTSGFGKDMYMLAAIHYIFERAKRIGDAYGFPNVRLVINFSYGFSGGRHDGKTELEAAIDELVIARRCKGAPTALVLPSGNTFLDRLHGQIDEAKMTPERSPSIGAYRQTTERRIIWRSGSRRTSAQVPIRCG